MQVRTTTDVRVRAATRRTDGYRPTRTAPDGKESPIARSQVAGPAYCPAMRTTAGTPPATTTRAPGSTPGSAAGLVAASPAAPAAPEVPEAPARLRRAQHDLLAGRVRAALAGFEEVAGAGDVAALPAVRTAALSGLTEARLARGDLAGAARAAQRAGVVSRAHGRATGACACAAWAAWAAAERDAAHGECGEALQHLEEVGRLLTRGDAPREPALLPWRASAAMALIRTGDLPRATVLAEEHLALAEAAGSAPGIAQALRVLAVTDVTGGREPLLRRARAVLCGVTARRLAAQVDTDLAGLLLLGGRAGEAAQLLRAVELYAASEGLWPLRSRARRLLDRHGEGEESRVWGEVERLTSAERRVVDLATERLTNREIASRLGVSVKAVEWHLSRVYRKLGVSSRLDLTRLLGRSA